MATTNLVSKTLGETYVQSGNGTPDHAAPIGAIYTDLNTNIVWVNNSTTGNMWTFIPPAIYGELYLPTNSTTLTTPSGVNTFVSLSGLTWNDTGNLKGFTRNNQKLVLNSGCTGTYRIMANMSMVRDSAAGVENGYRLGVSINGTASIPLDYQSSCYVTSIRTVGHGTVIVDRTLNAGDTIELTVAPIVNGTNAFYVRNATLIIYRVF